MRVFAESIPPSVRALPCWIPWEQVFRDGEYGKKPIGQDAPRSFDDALAHGAGVGIVPGKYGDTYLCVVDLDDCVADGVVDPWTLEKAKGFMTYAELSPSGAGLRLLFLSKAPFGTLEGRIDGRSAEAKCCNWFTVTGRRLDWSPADLADLTEQHPTLLADLFGYADIDRRTRQLLEWLPAVTLATPEGKDEVWDALMHLARWRVERWPGWFPVLCGLRNDDPGDLYKALAHDWSRMCPEQYDVAAQADIERLWAAPPRTEGSRYTLRNIRKWAKEDDPTGYKPREMHELLNDTGNGRILARVAAGRVAYVVEWEAWAEWDGARWDDNGSVGWNAVHSIAKEAVAERKDQLGRSYEKVAEAERALELVTAAISAGEIAKLVAERRKGLNRVWDWMVKSGNCGHLHSAIECASSEKLIGVRKDSLNQHPMLFNCVNGTVDLTTGEIRAHDPKDFLTQVCPTEWIPDAKAPRWEQFLWEVFKGDEGVIAFVQRLLGYCLTGDVREQVLPIFWGDGSNGKSKLIGAVMHTMGDDYSGTTPKKFLAEKKYDGHPTEMATLYGKRLIVDMEMSSQMKLDEELVKRLTGGDKIMCRRMNENFWTYEPTHKLILGTNYMPRVQGTDHAIWRRLKKVPFLQRFRKPEDEPKEGDIDADLDIEAKLKSEAPGILQWMIRGCLEWRRVGLGEPPAVREATKEFKNEQSFVRRFLAEVFERMHGGKVQKARVRHLWDLWRRAEGAAEMTKNAFARELTSAGVTYDTKGNFLGLRERAEGVAALEGD
jgi:P4 family phage/plasmid primase-like protien